MEIRSVLPNGQGCRITFRPPVARGVQTGPQTRILTQHLPHGSLITSVRDHESTSGGMSLSRLEDLLWKYDLVGDDVIVYADYDLKKRLKHIASSRARHPLPGASRLLAVYSRSEDLLIDCSFSLERWVGPSAGSPLNLANRIEMALGCRGVIL